jgi:2-hydroxy-3-keto-5-methylthiopentenyl-1-phosphate phosphatase
MPGPAALSHDQAGCVEPTRLAVRVGEANAIGTACVLESGFEVGPQQLGPLELQVELAQEGAAALAIPRVRNASAQPVRLDAVVLGFRWRRPGLASVQFLRHGWQSRSYSGSGPLEPRDGAADRAAEPRGAVHCASVEPPSDRSGWRESALVSAVGVPRGGAVCLVGAYESGHSFAVLYLKPERDGVRIEVELRLEAVLAPGDARALEPAHVALGCDAALLLEAFAEAYGRRARARAFRPFLASWCAGRRTPDGPSEDEVRRDLAALAAARERVPIDVVQIDDGWQRATGDWLESGERFPHGLAPLAGEIREAGFIPGLWTAPFCASVESALFDKHREWLLCDGREPLDVPVGSARVLREPLRALDTGLPEVTAHLEGVFREIVDMGFLYLTLDLLYAAALRASVCRIGRAQRLRRGLEAVRAGAGDEVFLLGCDCPVGAAIGVVDAMRVAPDAVRDAERIAAGDPRGATRNLLARAFMHRRLWLNDPGCVPFETSAALPEEVASSLASAVAGTGGPVALAGDAQRLTGAAGAFARALIGSARDVDAGGVPNAARVLDPLSGEIPERVVALDAAGGYLALFDDGDSGAERALGRGPRGAADPDVTAVESCIGSAPALGERADLRALGPGSGALLRVLRDTPLAVFCDFDGTFSVQDVGSTLALRHGGELRPETWARFERGEIRAWDYNMEVLDGLEVPLPTLEAFLHSLELDPGATELVAWCAARDVPFRIVSDGFDWNLNRLQQIHRVRFRYAANHLHYERGRWRIRPGRPNPRCACGTGSCKRSILEAFRVEHPRATLVHIGNGRVSDTCGALAADLAFAKDSLAQELERRGAHFESFETLRDVIPRLERALERSRAAASR